MGTEWVPGYRGCGVPRVSNFVSPSSKTSSDLRGDPNDVERPVGRRFVVRQRHQSIRRSLVRHHRRIRVLTDGFDDRAAPKDPYSNLANVTAACGESVDAKILLHCEPITQIEATLYANLGVIGVVGSADWYSGFHHVRKTAGESHIGENLPNGCVYRHFGAIVADVIAIYANARKSNGAAAGVDQPYAIFDWDARLAPGGDAMPGGVWPNPAILPPDMGVTQPPAVLHWTEIDNPEQLNVLSNTQLTGRWL